MSVAAVIQQHAEDAAVLHAARCVLVRAPHVQLHRLRRIDDRLAAHLDGLAIAAEAGWRQALAALEQPSPGAVFVAALASLESGAGARFDQCVALCEAVPEAAAGLVSALGWVEPARLRGLCVRLLGSSSPFERALGIAGCGTHRVDPGIMTGRRFEDPSPAVRARALRTAGELGRREWVSACAARIEDEDSGCRFWAAFSAVLLGDRQRGLDYLCDLVTDPSRRAERAFHAALLAMPLPAAHDLLKSLARDAQAQRWLIMGAGLVGDVSYVPWLIDRMVDDNLARLAGDAFSTITGADLAWLDLERKPPEDLQIAGPTDDAADAAVELDPDESLPWPDREKIRTWWDRNASRFTAGQRYFIGAPPSPSHCLNVLRTGYQRQRIAAALHRCLLEPGTPLFEWRAPAWRQARELARLGAG